MYPLSDSNKVHTVHYTPPLSDSNKFNRKFFGSTAFYVYMTKKFNMITLKSIKWIDLTNDTNILKNNIFFSFQYEMKKLLK